MKRCPPGGETTGVHVSLWQWPAVGQAAVPPQGPGSAPRGLGARAGPGQSVGQTQSWGAGQPGPPP